MTFCNYGVWMKLSEEKFAPVPLNSVSANVSIVDLVANVEIVQSFFNGENHAIEAVYKFPLIQAGMTNFSAEIDGREMKSAVDEMKEKRLNVFMVEVGGVAANSSVIVRLKYNTKLKKEGEELRFMLPKAIAPRYVPAKNESAASDSWLKWLLKTDHIQQVPYQLKFVAVVSTMVSAGTIKNIRSPTHKISPFKVFEIKNTVTLSETTATMNQDLILLIEFENSSNRKHGDSLSVMPPSGPLGELENSFERKYGDSLYAFPSSSSSEKSGKSYSEVPKKRKKKEQSLCTKFQIIQEKSSSAP